MGLRLFFLTNFPGAMLIQGATFIPDSRVLTILFMELTMSKEENNLLNPYAYF